MVVRRTYTVTFFRSFFIITNYDTDNKTIQTNKSLEKKDMVIISSILATSNSTPPENIDITYMERKKKVKRRPQQNNRNRMIPKP